ncbi:BMP family ABC transporter substrate-binding protein [Paenibacillus selenitireducens]|uniref:BMP family ABC transporter substrate-binding protein n=1 Tax=Paenibacillus selenitireducens TaxID=1324314 RepID=A0A1T2XKL9_9BACL|nr:BMP family ABC transporter substrate-binding protein [Paenibacillus selenitireducens]OPA80404.1 BMP family ABC transporter substrate-binding protein [Paenibacillus selenitireducens]
MKKALSLLIVLTIIFVTACSKDTSSGGNESTASNGANDALKVVLLIPGTLGDKSFFDAANNGLNEIKQKLGADTKVIEMGTDQTKWEPTFNDIASQDWDVIISGGSQITELMNSVAEKYQKKTFINYDTDINEVASNVYAVSYATNEISFLAGATAALLSTSNLPHANPEKEIGFVGGMDIPGINAFLVGYIEGAKYVVPDIKVAISYAGDFTNPGKGKELSLLQYKSGVDVIFNVAGGTGLGVFDAAKDQKKYAIGVDSDQSAMMQGTDDEKANLIVTSAIKKIDQVIFNAVKQMQAGTLTTGKLEIAGLKEDGVGLAENNVYQNVLSEQIRTQIADLKNKLASGEIKVSNAMGMDTSKIDEIRQSVKP